MKNIFQHLYIAFLVFAFASSLNGQVVYNDDGQSDYCVSCSTHTISNFQAQAGTNRVLMVSISTHGSAAMASITYNGQNLTQAVSTNVASFFYQDLWYLVLGTGGSITSNIVVTYTSTLISDAIIAATFQNVHQTTPIGNTIGGVGVPSTSSTLNLNGDTNDLIVDGIFAGNANLSNSQTTIAINGQRGMSYKPVSSGVNSMSWTFNSGLLVHSAAEINHDGVTLLPVELTFFKGETVENINVLKWQTASEQNNEGFDIEKSIDAQEWESIGYANGNGSTSEITNYKFIDDNPSNGHNYYRLKQIDFDGKPEYSNIESVTFEEQDIQFSIFPNPTNTKRVNLNIPQDETEVIIFNGEGKLMSSSILEQGVKEIPLEKYSSGIYFVKFINGLKAGTQRLIINE